jgi:hypothetical protein
MVEASKNGPANPSLFRAIGTSMRHTARRLARDRLKCRI